MQTVSLDKKIAVVSGGTGYLGSAVVQKLSDAGMDVVILYHNATQEIVESATTYSTQGKVYTYMCDLTNHDNVVSVFETITQEVGTIYACIHTAGVAPKPVRTHLASVHDLRDEFESNSVPSFNFLQVSATHLKARKQGVIVGITTAHVVTQHNTKSRGLYAFSKYALQGLLLSLHEELTSCGVRVFSVAPGVMEGGMNKATPKAFIDMVRSTSKDGSITSANEVASAIVSLCNGSNVPKDGVTLLLAPETSQ
jgi:NAD(P)-dependent dehydrogenase (short-subunit alcohol dehydrogenase family)